jgi:hypothetical protein
MECADGTAFVVRRSVHLNAANIQAVNLQAVNVETAVRV